MSALLWLLPAIAVAVPLLALAALALGVGPLRLLWATCTIFLFVSPTTGLLGLRTLARVGSGAPASDRHTARNWCYLALAMPIVIYLGLRWLSGS